MPPFTLSKLEGDAVFAFATDHDAVPKGSDVLACFAGCYAGFRQQVGSAKEIWPCWCDACANIEMLDLKFILHAGPFVLQEIAGQRELVGPEVVIAHRLLKSSAPGARGTQRLRSRDERRRGAARDSARRLRADRGEPRALRADRRARVHAQRLAEARHLDEAAVGRMVDLQRRVLDAELVVEQALELAPPPVAVLARPNEHVCGERREPGRDRPHVEVVDLDDARRTRKPATERIDVDAARRRLQEDLPSSRGGSTTRCPARATR